MAGPSVRLSVRPLRFLEVFVVPSAFARGIFTFFVAGEPPDAGEGWLPHDGLASGVHFARVFTWFRKKANEMVSIYCPRHSARYLRGFCLLLHHAQVF